MNQSSSFTVPLTFPNVSSLPANSSEPSEAQNIIEASFLAARPTAIQCWGSLQPRVEGNEEDGGSGVVIGCEDGTLYVFEQPVQPISIVETPPELSSNHQPKTPLRVPRSSRSNSQSGSPTAPSFALSPTYNLSARSRVVSGVTAEQVEAPKNYVDFEDEPDKLKDILKGKNPKERHPPSDVCSERNVISVKSPAPSIIAPVPSSKRKSTPRSLLSVANSPIQTPRSSSTPISPRERESAPVECPPGLVLKYHIIPVRSGSGRSVRAVEMLQDNGFIAVLQETGNISIYCSEDGTCVASVEAESAAHQVSSGSKDRDRPYTIWNWCSLNVSTIEQSTVLLVTAATDVNTAAATPDTEESSLEKSQTVMFEFLVGQGMGPGIVKLDRLGQWEFDGTARGLGIHTESDKSSSLFSINNEGHFLIRHLQFRPPAAATPTIANPESDYYPHLAIPKPFKAMMSRSTDDLPVNHVQQNAPKLVIHEVYDAGDLLSDSTLSGLSTRQDHGKLYGIVWAHREMTIFEYNGRSLQILYQTTVFQLENVEWIDFETYAFSYEDRMEIYRLKVVNADNDVINKDEVKSGAVRVNPELVRTLPTGQHDASTFAPTTDLILTKISTEGQRQLVSFHTGGGGGEANFKEPSQILWQSNLSGRDVVPRATVTSTLPLELDVIIQGYSDGRLRQYSWVQMAQKGGIASLVSSSSIKTSESALRGYITGLHAVQNVRTREKYVIGGVDDGSIAFWNINTFELCACWIVFSTPLVKVVEFQEDKVGPLRGCVLCIAQDGTIAVIVVDGFHFLYLIPGSPTPLKRICLGGHNLLLIYADYRSRLWDIQTKEFWRSMSVDKAEEMLAQGGWISMDLEDDCCLPKSEWKAIADSFEGRDAVATLSFSLERYVLDSIALTKTISTTRNEIRGIFLTLDRLRLLLSTLLTPGLSEDVDSICTGKLKVIPSAVGVGLTSLAATSLFWTNKPQDVWRISGNASALRMLAIVFVLRALSLFEELSEGAHTVISFYTTSLAACIGSQYKYPSLEYLGRRWFAASNDLRHSIRLIFDATVSRLSDENAIDISEKWQHHVPSLQPPADRETTDTALALFISGCVASEKYSLLSTNALTDISKSITLYLHDENSSYRVLAIDLCSRGFHVWQHYIDTMDILRSLFTLATSVRKDSISAQNVGAQARLAVLSIASQNTPLFMSTLCLDVLNPPTLEHRKSVMQIVAFLIRKRPFILQPNLSRLMEAVVKSLDPNSNTNREAVLDTATEIIGYVVKTFPTVDFHAATQRLAVGTNEGAVVMYDLKTAIRLYVLEGHKKQLTACSFSPDGRRLVTLSLAERLVLVWKVGSSFSSFFNPGAPPRQGHAGSQPYKTLSFNIGDEADMTIAETLNFVKFEWVADRSVKVSIREGVLTFST